MNVKLFAEKSNKKQIEGMFVSLCVITASSHLSLDIL